MAVNLLHYFSYPHLVNLQIQLLSILYTASQRLFAP
jgi:hypothetical protein